MPEKIGEETVFYIGRYVLPYPIKIVYEEEDLDYICAICNQLNITNCDRGIINAKRGLEDELTKAIEIYVHNSQPEELSFDMQMYRALLGEILRINNY